MRKTIKLNLITFCLLNVINITKNDEIHSFEDLDLKVVDLNETNLDSDFVPIDKVFKAYKSEEYFKELTKLFYNNSVVDFIRESFYKGNSSYDYYFKVLYKKENIKTLVIYKLKQNWDVNKLTSKLKPSSVEFKILK